jgi:GMP synthase (glutamine-hydrolysing)
MTADSFAFDHGILAAVANRIVNEVRDINRKIYDVTSTPPAPSNGNRPGSWILFDTIVAASCTP